MINTDANAKLDEILFGIDKVEIDIDDAWWATSVGAEFGRKKLAEVKAFFGQQAAEIARLKLRLEQAEDRAHSAEEALFEVRQERDTIKAKLAKAEEVIRPFADRCHTHVRIDDRDTVGVTIAARYLRAAAQFTKEQS